MATRTKMSPEEKAKRKAERDLAKEKARMEATIALERGQRPVKMIEISIEWKKSRMWGHNPHCSGRVQFQDGMWEHFDGITASGCGYDKESTVIADVFNKYLKYRLWEMYDAGYRENPEMPYGLYLRSPRESAAHPRRYTHEDYPWLTYNGGVGTDCYYKVSEFIGGTFRKTASGKSFDAFEFTMNEPTSKVVGIPSIGS